MAETLALLPPLSGRPIRLRLRRELRVSGGKLVRGHGTSVHAATFLNRRVMLLERELADSPAELRRVLVHELFHFVWRRLGNPRRASWESLVRAEWEARARGELGWSAEWRKQALAGKCEGRLWRDYLSESFCDTSAYLLRLEDHEEHTLAARCCRRRANWFAPILKAPQLRL